MNRRTSTLLLISVGACMVTLASRADAAPATFYVSPAGKDSWSGKVAAPAGDGQDGPFATLPKAIAAARTARQGGAIEVVLRAGTYTLTEPIRLTWEDSGASANAPFTIMNYPREKPVISGGTRITGWKRAPNSPNLWEAQVSDGSKWDLRSLFVNGRRANRARTPNEGSYFRMDGQRFSDRPAQFKFKPGDIKPQWANEPDAEIVGFEKWTYFRQRIRAVLSESNVVRLSTNAASHTHEPQAQYFVENTSDALDAPGEWRLDRKRGVVRYWPRPDEDLNTAEVIAPRLTELLLLQGDLDAKKPVRHVVLRGLTFSYTDTKIPPDGHTDSQAAVRIPGELRAEAAVDAVIQNCTFAHLGGYAIEFGRGCQRNRVDANDMFDIGAGGVRIGETDNKKPGAFDANHSHTIINNHMRQLGRLHPSAVGVLILQSGTNRVAHNHIHDLYYTAISVGWNWGYQETPCRGNVIEFNHLHDIGQYLLSDMGAVYTLGIQKGTVIRNNLIHDVYASTYGGWGLYTDEGSSHIVLENNIVYRCKSAGFHQHYGRENIVRNNIFAFGKEHQLMRSREEDHISFTFTNNIVYFDSGTLLGSTWKNNRFTMDRNIYFDARAEAADSQQIKFAGATLDQWRARGHDVHSLIADPRFEKPEKFDFRLQSGSPALKLGFKPINLSDRAPSAGLRPERK